LSDFVHMEGEMEVANETKNKEMGPLR